MSEFKYGVGDTVRVVKCSKVHWWYNMLIGSVFTVNNLRMLGDGPNYSVGEGLLLEDDVELVQSVTPPTSDKSLASVVAEVAALNVEQEAAEVTLKNVIERREKLLQELNALGLTLVVATPPAQTMRELYDAGQINKGDVFKWDAPDNEDREWTQGRSYIVQRVDEDDSVLITDNSGDNWAWKNEGSFDKFVKVAA